MNVRWLRCALFSLLLANLLIGSVVCLAQSDKDQYEYIDISNPFLRKIPLAVPLFKNAAEQGKKSACQIHLPIYLPPAWNSPVILNCSIAVHFFSIPKKTAF